MTNSAVLGAHHRVSTSFSCDQRFAVQKGALLLNASSDGKWAESIPIVNLALSSNRGIDSELPARWMRGSVYTTYPQNSVRRAFLLIRRDLRVAGLGQKAAEWPDLVVGSAMPIMPLWFK